MKPQAGAQYLSRRGHVRVLGKTQEPSNMYITNVHREINNSAAIWLLFPQRKLLRGCRCKYWVRIYIFNFKLLAFFFLIIIIMLCRLFYVFDMRCLYPVKSTGETVPWPGKNPCSKA